MKIAVFMFLLISFALTGNEVTVFEKTSEQSISKIFFEKDLKSKEKNNLIVKVEAKKGWHINEDFPLSLKPTSTCFKFSKEKYDKKDAKFTESNIELKTETQCEKSGKTDIKGTFSFGVCNDSLCKKETVNIEVSVDVK